MSYRFTLFRSGQKNSFDDSKYPFTVTTSPAALSINNRPIAPPIHKAYKTVHTMDVKIFHKLLVDFPQHKYLKPLLLSNIQQPADFFEEVYFQFTEIHLYITQENCRTCTTTFLQIS